jgi:hypothetical protein
MGIGGHNRSKPSLSRGFEDSNVGIIKGLVVADILIRRIREG